jgi:Na+/H+ antiporter NhaD/arsenite permease-like protein
MNYYIPIIVLAIVFVLIAIRKIGNHKFEIWQVMLGGAFAVLVTGQIPIVKAALAVNLDVICFLFGMFVVGEALTRSGYLANVTHKLFRKAHTPGHLILLILFVLGLLSALLMNDTLAILGTPLMISFTKKYKMSSKPLLLALAFAVTIGSVMSPIGNPQNLLVAITANVQSPFVTYLKYLLVPTILNLFIAYWFIKLFYGKELQPRTLHHKKEPIKDKALATLSMVSLMLIIVLILFKVIVYIVAPTIDFRLTYIALIGAAPIIFLSPRRVEVLKNIDWKTLVFFVAMFVLMESVWETGFFQGLISSSDMAITSLPMVFLTSVVISQFISNVPFVALYTPLLVSASASTKALMALVAGSTIAGNLTILGAASNVIIVQNAEKKGRTITFLEFAKIGIPLTLVNILVYWGFLLLF